MTKIYNKYDKFASFYNEYWTVGTPQIMLEAVKNIIDDKVEANASVLDICCGTGDICGEMYKLGYDVMGLDGSSKMIEYARENAPKVEFIVDDAQYFEIDKQFDVITCLFDSVNHLVDDNVLINVFKNCNKHLKSNGYFIFDINSEQATKDAVDFEFSDVTDDHAIITKTAYNKKTKLTTYTITTFVRNKDLWKRDVTEIIEKYHDPLHLVVLLEKSGFNDIWLADGYEALGIEEFEDRIFICAKKST